MTKLERAGEALRRAEETGGDPILRSLWLAKAVDHAIASEAVLVGGAAVNLHTGSYRPTDVDLCALLDVGDRRRLVELGLVHLQGDHFRYQFGDGEAWIVEFPETQVDGEVSIIQLTEEDTLKVIARESLLVDRVAQATDGTRLTFDEALRLFVAVYEEVDWAWLEGDLARRDAAQPDLGLADTYRRLRGAVEALLRDGGEV